MRPDAEQVVVAIHQPNFFPWLGWFNKVSRADVMVLLDDAQFPKKGGTWCNRVKILAQGKEQWLTAPIVRSFEGTREIREIEFNEETPWRRKMVATLRTSYGKAPAFDETMPVVEELLSDETSNLADFNIGALRRLVELLELTETKIVRSSELGVASAATDRLIELTRAVGGSVYMAGGGAGGYQDDSAFARAGIELREQDFGPAPYPQRADEPVPGLSVVDALMHCGREGTAALIAGQSPGATDGGGR